METYTKYRKRWHCNECDTLEVSFPFKDCCPECGGTDIKQVIARWKIKPSALGPVRYLKSEIRS